MGSASRPVSAGAKTGAHTRERERWRGESACVFCGFSHLQFLARATIDFDVAQTCRRDLSKKEKQLLSPEDHERLAAAALESEVLLGR